MCAVCVRRPVVSHLASAFRPAQSHTSSCLAAANGRRKKTPFSFYCASTVRVCVMVLGTVTACGAMYLAHPNYRESVPLLRVLLPHGRARDFYFILLFFLLCPYTVDTYLRGDPFWITGDTASEIPALKKIKVVSRVHLRTSLAAGSVRLPDEVRVETLFACTSKTS